MAPTNDDDGRTDKGDDDGGASVGGRMRDLSATVWTYYMPHSAWGSRKNIDSSQRYNYIYLTGGWWALGLLAKYLTDVSSGSPVSRVGLV